MAELAAIRAAAKYSLESVFSAKSDNNAPGGSAGANTAYAADAKVKITDRACKTVSTRYRKGLKDTLIYLQTERST